MTKEKVTNAVIFAIVSLYIAATIAGIIDHSYQMPISLHALVGTIATFLFGDKLLRRTGDKYKDNKGSSSNVDRRDSTRDGGSDSE